MPASPAAKAQLRDQSAPPAFTWAACWLDVEVELAALLSFGLGLLLAYLLELRRRSNAQWSW